MSATNHTPNLNLSQFIPLDKPAWLGDYNSDMSKIDTAVHKVQTQADSMETAVEQATTAAQAATQAAQAATEAAQDAADKAQDAETTANNIAGSLAGKVNKTGDTMTGPLVLPGDPTEDNQAATKGYVDKHGGGGNYLPLSGGTMTGPLVLSANPTSDMQATTKKYVDSKAGGGKLQILSWKVNADTNITPTSGFTGFGLNQSVVIFCGTFRTNQAYSKGDTLFTMPLPAKISSLYSAGFINGANETIGMTASISEHILKFQADSNLMNGVDYSVFGYAFDIQTGV